MSFRSSLLLLQTAVLAIIFLLSLVAGLRLAEIQEENEKETVIGCGVVDLPRDSLYRQGKLLWNRNGCGACHNKSMRDHATAPVLGGVEERWAAYPRADLFAFIRNSRQLTAEGHPRARVVAVAWEGSMNLYPNLTDGELVALLAYIDGQYVGRP
ncbi:MAG: cytochrome c [Bacteroidota bacterium]